jgi:hypothetical protein
MIGQGCGVSLRLRKGNRSDISGPNGPDTLQTHFVNPLFSIALPGSRVPDKLRSWPPCETLWMYAWPDRATFGQTSPLHP